jgi:phosphonate transport system substrate-binding protein
MIIASLAVVALSACRSTAEPTATATPNPTPAFTLTPLPTRTVTPQPQGSEQNPLVLGIVSPDSDPNVLAAADETAAAVQKVTGYVIKAQAYLSYADLISEMSLKHVQMAFLPPLTYLYAKELGFAEVAMLSNHFGVYQYASRFFANAASKFTSYYDPKSDRSTTDAATALKQFQGKQPCWVDPQSPSGYILPLGLLKSNDLEVKDGAFLVSPVGVIRALYITGICDFGATFATTGDPRTSPAVNQDLTDVMNRVLVIYQTDPVIPSNNLSFHPMVKPEIREDLTYGFKDLVKDAQGQSTLSTAVNYEIVDLQVVNDSFYEPFRSLVDASGADLVKLIGR